MIRPEFVNTQFQPPPWLYDAVVVGAGIHGCSVALHLARRGWSVLVLEKNMVGQHASGVNAGGVRLLGRHLAEIPLSVASMKMWHNIETVVDTDCGFHATGQIRVAENLKDLEILAQRVAILRNHGYNHEELIDQNELHRRIPTIGQSCLGGLISCQDGLASPYHATIAFAHKAAHLGACFMERTSVTSLAHDGDRWRVLAGGRVYSASVIVNCAGAWGDRIASMVGDYAPQSVKASMLMVTERMPPFLGPVVSLTNRKLSFKQTSDGTVVIGGGYVGQGDLERETTNLELDGLSASAETVVEVFPHMHNVQITRCWAGLEGVMPDGLPVIGIGLAAPRVFHAFGFSGHGFQLGPIVGKLLGECIIDGKPSIPLGDFSIKRFNAPAQQAADK